MRSPSQFPEGDPRRKFCKNQPMRWTAREVFIPTPPARIEYFFIPPVHHAVRRCFPHSAISHHEVELLVFYRSIVLPLGLDPSFAEKCFKPLTPIFPRVHEVGNMLRVDVEVV